MNCTPADFIFPNLCAWAFAVSAVAVFLFLLCSQSFRQRPFFRTLIQQISDTPFTVIHTEYIIFIAVGILDAPCGISLMFGTDFLSGFVKLNGVKFSRLLL